MPAGKRMLAGWIGNQKQSFQMNKPLDGYSSYKVQTNAVQNINVIHYPAII